MHEKERSSFLPRGAGARRRLLPLFFLACVAGLAAEAPAAGPEGFLAFGLRHVPLGEARLALDEQGNLVVSGLGKSAEDGLAIELGEADRWYADWLDLDPADRLPDGSSLTLSFEGRVDGAPDRPLGSLIVEDIGDTLEISADFAPLGATTYTIEVRNGGEHGTLVYREEGHRGPVAQRIQWPFSGHVGSLPGGGIAVDFDWRGFKDKHSVTIVGGPTVVGDYLCIAPEDATARAGTASRAILRTREIPSLTLIGESLGAFGLSHYALGEVELTAERDRLTVHNPSGRGGVETEIEDGAGWDARWAQINGRTLPEGASLGTAATGTVDGVPGSPIGSTRAVVREGTVELHTSFAPLGARTLRYDFLRHGKLVESLSGQRGDAALRLANGGRMSFTRDAHYSIIGTGEPCSSPGYPCLFAGYTFGAGGAAALAIAARFDEIRVYPEDVTVKAVTALESVRLELVGIPELQLVEESVQPLP